MSKTLGNFFECDRHCCKEAAFVPEQIALVPARISGMLIPDGWRRFDGGAVYCPDCAKSFTRWNESPENLASACEAVEE